MLMNRHITDTVVMVPPDSFGYNSQTAGTNVFQHTESSIGLTQTGVQEKAQNEFRLMKTILTENGIRVLELQSPKIPCPDAVFPNNWFSHHEDGTLVVYPMLTPNRRNERQVQNLTLLLRKAGIPVTDIVNLSPWEKHTRYLEGTGSITLDRAGKTAFAMESARTTPDAFFAWCESFSYKPILFHGYDNHRIPIYHTNILMNIGNNFAVICTEAIPNTNERDRVLQTLQENGKEIISISLQQMLSFCGNILQLKTHANELKIILSSTAHNAFLPDQRMSLEKHGKLIPIDISTIETIGGGSSRCMLAEVFHTYGDAG